MFSTIGESEDLTPFGWIEQELRSPVGRPPKGDTALRLVDLLPLRFAAYAKIFHPIYEDPDRAGQDTTWDEVEKAAPVTSETERILRKATLLRTRVDGEPPREWRRVRWSELAEQFGLAYGVGLTEKDLDRAWPGRSWPARFVGPDEGNLTTGLVTDLVHAIQAEGDPGTCFFWWWIVACMGTLKPDRDHMFRGRLHHLPRFLSRRGLPSPTYWWPESRAWCVATDWDLCFSVMGGPASLVARVLASPEVEGLAVGPADALLEYPKRR